MTEFHHSDEIVDIHALTAPFPKQAIEKRDGGRGQSFDFVATETVIRRLNAATGNRWSFRVTNMEWRPWRSTSKGDPQELLIISGELTIPGLGTRAGTGVQIVNVNGGEDMIKGGASDCLKKAAVSFGVGIDLYGPDLEAGEVQQRQSQQQQAPAPAPQRQLSTTEQLEADIATIVQQAANCLTIEQLRVAYKSAQRMGLHEEPRVTAAFFSARARIEA